MDRRLKELLMLLIIYLVTIWLIASVVFLWWRVLPGDPALIHAPRTPGGISDEFLEAFSVFEKPLFEQYSDYMGRTLTGQFYYSIAYDSSISGFIYDDLSWSLFLFSFSFGISLLLAGLMVKYLARPSRDDRIRPSDGVSLLMFSLCPLVMAIALQQLASHTDILPSYYHVSITHDSMSLGDKIVDALKHVILPMLSLVVLATGALMLILRAGGRRLRAMAADDSSSVKGRGGLALSSSAREMMPSLHFLIAGLIGFLAVVELQFGYRGVFWVFSTALYNYDAFLLEACAFLIPAIALTVNVLVEAVAILMDPRLSGSTAAATHLRERRAVLGEQKELWPSLLRFASRTLRRPGGLVGGLIMLILIGAAVIGMTIPEEQYLSPFMNDYDIASATLKGAGTSVGVVLLVMFVSLPIAVVVGYMVAVMNRELGEASFLVEMPARALTYCYISFGLLVPLMCFALIYRTGIIGGEVPSSVLLRATFVSSFCGLFLVCLAEGARRLGTSASPSARSGLWSNVGSEDFVSVAAHAFRACKFIAPLTMLGVLAADFIVGFGWTSWGTVLMELWHSGMFVTHTWMVIPPAMGIAALVIGSYLLADSAEKVLSERVRE